MKQQQLRLKKRLRRAHFIGFSTRRRVIGAPRSSSPSFPIFNHFSVLDSDVPAPSAENVIELAGPINMVLQPKTEQKIHTTIIGNGLNLYSLRLNFRLSTQVVLPKSRP